MTIAVPCPETERNSLIPSTVLTTSSSGCVTSDSTSSGAAPGRPTRTETVGRSTEGKRSTPSRKKPAAPTTTSDNTIIVAKTGRRIQISASFCIKNNKTCVWLVDNFDSLTRLQVARINNYLFPDINSRNNFRELSATATGRDRFLQCFSVLDSD